MVQRGLLQVTVVMSHQFTAVLTVHFWNMLISATLSTIGDATYPEATFSTMREATYPEAGDTKVAKFSGCLAAGTSL